MPIQFHELERLVLGAFRQALADGRLDVAEHLLHALERLQPTPEPGSSLAAACKAFLRMGDATGRGH